MGLSFGRDSSHGLVFSVVRPLWVAAHSRNIIVVADDHMGRMAKLVVLVGAYFDVV